MAHGNTCSHRRKQLGRPSEARVFAILFLMVGATVLLGLLVLINQPR